MIGNTAPLAERYAAALESYLDGAAEEALQQAYEVGRDALEAGVGPLVLFSLHRDLVQKLPPRQVDPGDVVSQVTTVFVEALAPYEMTAGSFDDLRMGAAEVTTILQRHRAELEAVQNGLNGSGAAQLHGIRTMLQRHAREIDDIRRRLEGHPQGGDARRQLIADIVHAQEEERRRLAGDIHDDAVQSMTAVLLRMGLLGTRLTDSEQVQIVEELEGSVRDTIARLRRLLVGLAPPELDRGGLASAVTSALDELKLEFDIDYTLDNRLEREPGPVTRTIAYRVVQEALANARKHARASLLEASLESRDDGLLAQIVDNGVGFDVEAQGGRIRPGHLGLAAMRERTQLAAGWFRIESRPGRTAVTFWLPDQPAPTRA